MLGSSCLLLLDETSLLPVPGRYGDDERTHVEAALHATPYVGSCRSVVPYVLLLPWRVFLESRRGVGRQ